MAMLTIRNIDESLRQNCKLWPPIKVSLWKNNKHRRCANSIYLTST